MNKENNIWSEEEGTNTSPTFREAYLNAVNQNRLQPRASETPQEEQPPETPSRPAKRTRPRGIPGAGPIYEMNEADEPGRDPRTTRQAHDETLARLRQRPSREQAEEGPKPAPRPTRPMRGQEMPEEYPTRPYREASEEYPTQPTRPRREPPDAYSYQPPAPRSRTNQREGEQYGDYEPARRHQRQSTHSAQPHRHKRGGRAATTIITGCVGGLLTVAVLVALGAFYLLHNTPLGQNFGKTTYTQQINQSLDLGKVTMVIVKNQVGNVSINVDANASSANLSSVEKTQASSQSGADSQFHQMVLTNKMISQGADPACTASSCLLISATVPASSGSGLFGGGNSSSIDLTLTLPSSFNSPDPTAPSALTASSASGNLVVNGFNGVLNLTGNSGDISVTHTLIFSGTCLQTMQGNINVGQGSIFDLTQPSMLIPCSTRSSSGSHPWFQLSSGRGNVDLTLTAPSTNLLLDANTNNGKITNDFGLTIPTSSDGSASYHGLLLPNSNPIASLYVFTSTGDIGIHKQ